MVSHTDARGDWGSLTTKGGDMDAGHTEFDSFLVDGHNRSNIFRVMALGDGITRAFAERFLKILPVQFRLQADFLIESPKLGEPIEVWFGNLVVEIYPPKHRVIGDTWFNSWTYPEIFSGMRFENVADMLSPGRGQIRSSVSFDPKILGIWNWPYSGMRDSVTLEIFVFPKGKEKLVEPKPPLVDLLALLDNLAGGEALILPLSTFKELRELIMYVVAKMRISYERRENAETDPSAVYFARHWANLDAAGDNPEKLLEALEFLREAIRMK